MIPEQTPQFLPGDRVGVRGRADLGIQNVYQVHWHTIRSLAGVLQSEFFEYSVSPAYGRFPESDLIEASDWAPRRKIIPFPQQP